MHLEFIWRNHVHDETDDGGVEVGNKNETDAAHDESE